jgi:hypothetical protein
MGYQFMERAHMSCYSYGHAVNYMKGGLMCADRIITVGPSPLTLAEREGQRRTDARRKQLRIGLEFGGRGAHAAVSRRPPISLDTIVARTHMYTVRRESLGFCPSFKRHFRVAPVPNLRSPIHRCFLSCLHGRWQVETPLPSNSPHAHIDTESGCWCVPAGVAWVRS